MGAEDKQTQAGLGEDEDPGRQPPLPLWPGGAGQGPARPSHSVNTHSPDGPQGRSEPLEGVFLKEGACYSWSYWCASVHPQPPLLYLPLLSPLYFRQFLNIVFMSFTNSSLEQYKPPFSFFSMLEISMGTYNRTR